MKVATGEFTKHNKAELRSHLFAFIEDLAPNIIESMQNDLYPYYVKAFPEHNIKSYAEVNRAKLPEASMFNNQLKKWCKNNGLHQQWSMDKIVYILSTWRKEYCSSIASGTFNKGNQRKKLRGRIFALPSNENPNYVSDKKPLIPELEPWDAWFETEKEFRSRVEQYILQVRTIYLNDGWEEGSEKRNRGAGALIHLKWLVQKKFLNKTISDIAQEHMDSDPTGQLQISNDAVRKAIQKISKVIDL